MNILAVDDNAVNLELISDILSTVGYQVSKAFDGAQALERIREKPPDLILLDVNMPGMSGFEVMSKLKADDQTAKIPVIFLTALSDINHRVEGLDLGADDYLVKPYSPRELIARIEARIRAKAETDVLIGMQRVIRQTFERFVSANIVEQMLEDPQRIKLGGKLQEVTVMFTDIQGFTASSEYTDPELLLTLLNQYHELVVEIVLANSGTIDKFLGDGVMALFNTPLPIKNHALRAVQAACQVQNTLDEFYQDVQPAYRWPINFGIHTGTAVVGNVGSSRIMDFTAVGDTVNVASRLQTQAENGQIMISDAVYEHVKDRINIHEIGPITYKNRQQQVMTFEVLTCDPTTS